MLCWNTTVSAKYFEDCLEFMLIKNLKIKQRYPKVFDKVLSDCKLKLKSIAKKQELLTFDALCITAEKI
jgi:hypothetical protein